jgi:hypothetical protein
MIQTRALLAIPVIAVIRIINTIITITTTITTIITTITTTITIKVHYPHRINKLTRRRYFFSRLAPCRVLCPQQRLSTLEGRG